MTFTEDELIEVEGPRRYDLRDVSAICSAIIDSGAGWEQPTRRLGLSPDWMPHLVAGERRVCHIHIVARLRDHFAARISAAQQSGREVVVAAPLDCWQSEETLILADELRVVPILVAEEEEGWAVTPYRSVAALIAGRKLLLNPASLQRIGESLLKRAQDATGSNVRGKLFEDFLAFFFSQVRDFEVFAQNYNTETEEIDLVLTNRRTEGRAWPPSTPLVLVSGKNTKAPVGAPSVTSLESKINMRRGMCHLGFLCASGAIARTAFQHELRYSTGETVVAFLDGQTFARLLAKPKRLTAELERHVIEASLR